MDNVLDFLASTTGRIARVVAGVVLIALGVSVGDTVGMIITVVGVVPILTGLFDICLLAPFMGLPADGAQIRAKK